MGPVLPDVQVVVERPSLAECWARLADAEAAGLDAGEADSIRIYLAGRAAAELAALEAGG